MLRSQTELADALEAETVVLRQRVAELSQAIERMQRDLAASQTASQAAAQAAAQAARVAAEEAAKATPWASAARWWESNWPFLAAMVGIASLLAVGLLYRRRREPTAWPAGALPADRFDATYMEAAVPGTPAMAGPYGAEIDTGEGPITAGGKAAARPAPQPKAPDAVAVSELSQATEEARVFLTLGHVDRAMGVLREHIDRQPRSMPAAWLMLLDLYRTHGREQEFRKLAENFHLQFNAQTPVWAEWPVADPNDPGLEGFPHLVKQLTSNWGTPACRDALDRLLYDNRKGRRTGFSFASLNEILTLRQLNDLIVAGLDSDAAEEAKVRAAWAAATGRPASPQAAPPAPAAPGQGAGRPAGPVNLDLDLDSAMKPPGGGSEPPR
jgi:hypothetical protein